MVRKYLDEWILHIHDITEFANDVKSKVDAGLFEEALAMLPREDPYPIAPERIAWIVHSKSE